MPNITPALAIVVVDRIGRDSDSLLHLLVTANPRCLFLGFIAELGFEPRTFLHSEDALPAYATLQHSIISKIDPVPTRLPQQLLARAGLEPASHATARVFTKGPILHIGTLIA